MKLDIARTRKLLKAFDFETLFREELGWEPQRSDLTVTVEGQAYRLQTIAHKRGFMVLWLAGQIPAYATRRKIETQVAKSYHEHLIVYTDAGKTEQRWQWVRREAGKPAARRESVLRANDSGDALLQKLQRLVVTLEEEDDLTIVDVAARVKSAFDVEKVTKKFYERFKQEHTAFLKFLKGIPDEHLQRWYVSVTLNRLMFVYFVQKKGFLDGDPDYLRHKLAASQTKGADRFYREFLCPLFFEGFAKKQRPPQIRQLLGRVPYLNGGIFERHQIEELHGETIEIPDAAFERLFDFFDGYQWHLDERPLRRDNEINPDVLGYIFEKYINQKQMGAYYTKEDITEYISKNTIIPHLFDAAGVGDFRSFENIGSLLASDPDRYIYPAVRHGVIDARGQVIPESALPDFVQTGMRDPNARMFDKRYNLQMAEQGDPLRLPTETWREYASRRQRCLELRQKLSDGQVTAINDLITLNLDIRQFAQDVIEDSDADLLLAFWKALTQIKILDPTVGSGAFLFAALNVLEPLYEACLERMSALVEELDRSGEKHSPKKYEPFRKALAQVRQRPDEDYFIFKSIIINNLYGVDIMEEAVEICKLRLFLKLAAQVEPDPAQDNLGIEPLPDIDFNIRAGNTLVGFATREDVKRSVQFGTVGGVQSERLFAMPEEDAQLRRIEEKAEDVDRLYKLFRQQQTEYGGEVRPEDKRELQKRLGELEKELNILLAKQYAIHNPKGEAYQKWLASHTPFHWFVEFYGIMNDGGFDVIVGNPPYLNLAGFKEYEFIGYSTQVTGNLYSMVLERCQNLGADKGRQGYIVPVSSTATEGYLPLQKEILKRELFVSCYDDRPAHLFNDLDKNTLSIIVMGNKVKSISGHSTRLCRWSGDERPHLFATITYQPFQEAKLTGCIAKIGSPIEKSIWQKVWAKDKALASYYSKYGKYSVFYSRKINSFLQVLDFTPEVRDGKGNIRSPSEFKELSFETELNAKSVYCCLSSSLFRWFVDATTDGSHLNKREIDNFPFDPVRFQSDQTKVTDITKRLSKNLRENSEIRVMKYAHDTLSVQCIIPKHSKPIIDEIDRALARHYGLSDEELDFIINYDIKYRMGADNQTSEVSETSEV